MNNISGRVKAFGPNILLEVFGKFVFEFIFLS